MPLPDSRGRYDTIPSPSPSPSPKTLALALALALQYYPYCRGGPNISEGVQILQYYPEVFGPGGPKTSKYLDRESIFSRSILTGGPFLGGSIFFVTDPSESSHGADVYICQVFN